MSSCNIILAKVAFTGIDKDFNSIYHLLINEVRLDSGEILGYANCYPMLVTDDLKIRLINSPTWVGINTIIGYVEDENVKKTAFSFQKALNAF
jgi:hypothetical protein